MKRGIYILAFLLSPLLAAAQSRDVEVLDAHKAEILRLSYDPQGFWLKGTDIVKEFSIKDAGELIRKFFETMRGNFLRPVSNQEMFSRAIAALSSRLDPAKRIKADMSGRRIMLYDSEFRVLGNFPAIDSDDSERWANMLVSIIVNLRKTNAVFAEMHAEQIYYLVLGGITKWADSGGNYMSAFGVKARDQMRSSTMLGASHRATPEGLQILSVLQESPIYYSGIDDGDLIISINGRDARKMRLEEIEAAFFGDTTDMVNFKYISYNTGLPGEATARKAKFKSRRVAAGTFVGYPSITVYNFGEGAATEMKVALDNAKGDALVLDLRAAQGGTVEEALEAANLFLNNRDMLHISARDGGRRTYTSKPTDHWGGKRILALIDNSTRGTGEVFALALSGRAAFLGTPSAGDGFYRTRFELTGGRETECATGEIFSMKGRSLAVAGVVPAACLSSLVDETSVRRFVASLAENTFKDNRNLPLRATKEDAERIRKACPATYPGEARERLFEMAAAALIANHAAFEKLRSYD